MKVGILTFHRAHNYGAVLQCYALQKVIRDLGCEVEVIDYKQPHIESFYKKNIHLTVIFNYFIHLKLSILFKYIRDYLLYCKRKDLFRSFRQKYLNCSNTLIDNLIPDYYDRYVIGSDQVWGLHCCGGYDPVYFGGFAHSLSSKIYGYAISSNGDFLNFFSKKELTSVINRFVRISFREKNIRDKICDWVGENYPLSLDPTLLTNVGVWDPLIKDGYKKRKYVVIYHIRGSRYYPGQIEKNVYSFAANKGYEVMNFSTMNFHVEDFVSSIKYAQCVFTSSFHATVFSIIFGTPFYSYTLNDGHDGRYVDLLKSLNLNNHLLSETDQINNPMCFDYEETNAKLLHMREDSLDYLKEILS